MCWRSPATSSRRRSRGRRARRSSRDDGSRCAAPLARGMRIVAVAGNHDRDYFMETANVWLGRARHATASERIILRTQPELLTVRAGGERVNFALLPFPTPARYDLRRTTRRASRSATSRSRSCSSRRWRSSARRRRQQQLPTVLLTHVTVDGHDGAGAPHLAARRRRRAARRVPGVRADRDRPHPQGGADRRRATSTTSAALDRMDVGEKRLRAARAARRHRAAGRARDHVAAARPDAVRGDRALRAKTTLHAAAAALDRRDETLVKLTLVVPHGTYTAPLLDLARQLFPRLYGNVEHRVARRAEGRRPSVAGLNPADVDGNGAALPRRAAAAGRGEARR